MRTIPLWGLLLAALCTGCGASNASSGSRDAALTRSALADFDATVTAASLDAWLEKWIAPDFRGTFSGASLDRGGMREAMTAFLAGFSEIRHDIHQIVASGDTVTVVMTVRMKHTGTFAGIGPTGREVVVSEIDVSRVRDGKVVEQWAVLDSGALLQQLTTVSDSAGSPPH